MRPGWSRPMYAQNIVGLVLQGVVQTALLLVLDHLWETSFILWYLPFILVASPIAYLYVRRRYRAIWNSTSRQFEEGEEPSADRIERALRAESIPFTTREGYLVTGVHRFIEVFEVGQLNIGVDGSYRSQVFIWPIEKGMVDEVERLKGLVDKALG